VQNAIASVAVGPVEMADFAVGIINEYEGLRIYQWNVTPKV
jgi:hypothetical protein